MTVSSANRKAGPFLGNDVTTAFPFTFKVFKKEDVAVTFTDLNGVDSELVLDSDYSVALNPDQNNHPGGTIAYPILGAPLATGTKLTLTGDLAYTQPTDLPNLGPYFAEVVEDAFDRAEIQIQQLKEITDRAIKISVSDTPLTPLPAAPARANTVIGFDALGNVVVLPLPASIGAGDMRVDVFVGGVDFTAGVTNQITLSRPPGNPANLEIFFDPLYQGPDQWSLNGSIVTFTAPIPVGVSKVFARIGTTLSTQIPPAGSVGDLQIAWVDILNRIVTSIAQLKALDTARYTRAFATGFYASGDGGGGNYWFNAASSATEVPGIIVTPNSGVGRWELILGDALRPEQAGAKGNGVFDDQPALQAVSDFLLTRPGEGGNIKFSFGRTYAVGAMWNVPKTVGKRIVIDGAGARLQNLPSYDSIIMRFGELTGTVGGPPLTMRDVHFNAVTANATGIYLQWGGASVLENCGFTALRQGMLLENTFALVVRSCIFNSNNLAGILVNNTQAHHLVVTKSFFYDNARDVYFAGAGALAHNIVIDACDMEGGGQALVCEAAGSTVTMIGNYIEGKSAVPVLFGATMTGFTFKGNWLGFMPATQMWQNIVGGEIVDNVFWDQAQTVAATCADLDISHNTYNGTSNLIYSPFTPPTLINGFSNFGGGYASAGYRKDGRGMVQLQGMVQAGADNVAFVLPVGYRPASRIVFPILGAAGGVTVGRVDLFPDGSVTVIRASGTADLSAISFTATA